MQFYPQTMRRCSCENLSNLVGRKRDPFAKSIDCVRQPFARDLRDHLIADQRQIARTILGKFRRQRMRAEISHRHIHRPDAAEFPDCP